MEIIKKFGAVLCALALILTLAACNNVPSMPNDPFSGGNSPEGVIPNGVAPESAITPEDAEEYFEDTSEMDFSFSKGDMNSAYDESNATVISLSDSGSAVTGEGALADETGVRITAAGTYILSGDLSNGGITVETLDTEKVSLVLVGVSIVNENGPAIYVKESDKVFLILAEGSENILSDGESYTAVDGETTLDGAVFSRADLAVNGSGSLTVNGKMKHGVVSKDDLVITGGNITVTSLSAALVGKDCVKIGGGEIKLTAGSDGIRSDNTEDANRGYVYINGGKLDITAGNDGIQAETVLKIDGGEIKALTGGGSVNGPAHYDNMGGGMGGFFPFGGTSNTSSTESYKGLKAGSDILVSAAKIEIDSADDSIHSNGSISINGGDIIAISGDDGIHADTALAIYNGNITVSKSYEGLEGTEIAVFGGNIYVVASDDGLNAAGGNDGSAMGRPGANPFEGTTGDITISGGSITVDASGDGIDSNGSITVTGGITMVSGPDNNGNGAFDYGSTAHVSGGTLIALGASGMAQGFSSAEGQGAIFCTFNTQRGGSLFEVRDGNGDVIVSFTPAKNYQCAVVTSPDIQKGNIYTLTSDGNTIASVEMTSELYGSSGGMGGMGGMGGGRPGGGERPGGDFRPR